MFRPSLSSSRRSIAFLAILSWMFFLGSPYSPAAHAQSMTDRITGNPKVPWQISADTVDYDSATTTYYARGDVVIEKEAVRLTADKVSFNHNTMTATAAGHVLMTVGDDLLTGEMMELDLNRQTGVVHDGSVFLKENHFYIRGRRIEKTGKDTYRAEQAAITSCDGQRPDWTITGRTVSVTVEGYGSVTHAVLKARELPVLYTPYLLFPAKTRRQTGLLTPEASVSDRKGVAWDQPFFWAIGESSDATLYTHYMQERGTKIGLEYRYALTDKSIGIAMADGLEDQKVDDGSAAATQQWGYPGDAYDRPNTDRYWLRAKLDQELPGEFMARLDLDVVSDQDYLTEFKDGLSGYDQTREAFLETFGRDLDTYDESIRTNRLNVNRTWARYVLNGDLLWNDNVNDRRWEDVDPTLQQLPVVQFSGAKQRAFGSGVFWDLDSEYTHFYREDGDRGQRMDLYPRAYLPLRWKNYLSVEPSAGWRQTAWMMDRWEDDTLDRSSYRQIYDARLDLSTEFSKVMDAPLATVERIRHSIKPRAVYEYVPDQDQNDLPEFDTWIDRIQEANRVTYSLTNTFTARMAQKARNDGPFDADTTPDEGRRNHNSMDPEDRSVAAGQSESDPYGFEQPEAVLPVYGYNRFCRFYLEQTYDIAAARDDDPEPFSDLYGELDFNLGRHLSLYSDASFDTYQSRFASHNVAAALADRRGDQLWIEHRFQENRYESIRGRVTVKLTDRLKAKGEYERNLMDGTDISKGLGFLYAAQCWSVACFYTEEGQDQKISFFINLMGIGGFGSDG